MTDDELNEYLKHDIKQAEPLVKAERKRFFTKWFLIGPGVIAYILVLNGCASTRIGFGPTAITGEFTGSVTVLAQADVSDQWRVTAGYISSSTITRCGHSAAGAVRCFDWDLAGQTVIGVEYVWRGERWSASLGPYLVDHPDRITSCRNMWRPAIEYRVTNYLSLGASHFSNAGFCGDMLFQSPIREDFFAPDTFNVGYDAALVWIGPLG